MNRVNNLQGTKNHLPQKKLTQKFNFTQNAITHTQHELGENDFQHTKDAMKKIP